MKKTTLLILFCVITFSHSNAQLSEDFEGSFPPTDWSISDNGIGTTISWESNADAFSGTGAAFIDYDETGASQDWLISPQFTPNASNNILSFFQKQGDNIEYGSTFTIRVSESGTNIATDFIIPNGYSQTESDFGNKYELKTVDLSAYNDIPIYIAFVIQQDLGESWFIDKVSTVNPSNAVPECAMNHLPMDTATDVANLAGEVFLSWDGPASVVVPSSYEVWIGPTENALVLEAEVGNTNYKMTGAVSETTYYWKVVPKNYSVSPVSCVTKSFTTQFVDMNPPVNDSCFNAINITATPYENTQDATYATNNSGNIDVCGSGSGSFSGMNDGVWYTFTSNIGGAVNIDITNVSGSFNVEVAVYSGTCGNFTCVGFKDTAATGAGDDESLSVEVDAATQYWINVGSNSASDETEGAFKIALSSGSGVILGVDKIEDNLDVSLYPNPTSDIINIRYNNAIDAIRIYNLLGQEVKNVTLNKSSTQIDMSNFNSGMYIVEVYSGSSKGSYRVIKQ